MYKFIAVILISFIVPVIIGYFRCNNKNQNKSNLLYYPKIYMIFAIVAIIFLAIVFIFEEFETRFLPLYIAMVIMAILSVYMILLCVNYKVEFHNDFFEYKNIFGKKYIFEYQKITELHVYYSLKTKEIEKYIILIGKKKIEINYMMINFLNSLSALKKTLKRIKQLHKVKIKEINKNHNHNQLI